MIGSLWRPQKDTVWAFKTRYVDRVDIPSLITKFCDQFGGQIDESEEPVICPIGLYCDGSLKSGNKGKIKRVAELTLKNLENRFDWWDTEYDYADYAEEFNKSLDWVVKDPKLEGSIIFRVKGGSFTLVTQIQILLFSLGYCAGLF